MVNGDSSREGVRGDLRMNLGAFTEARVEIQRAIPMTMNLPGRQLLAKKLKEFEKATFSV
jgi:predicted RNA polymerase sigma factor